MKTLYAAAAVFLSIACGSAPMPVVTGAPGHRDVLFEPEIDTNKTPGMTVYDLIAHLRPEYLRSRGSNSFRDTTPPTAVVYLDGARLGSLEQMKSLSADRVSQIQYLSAANAQTRFGMDHTGGAILIISKVGQ
jgi:hypothetical protein